MRRFILGVLILVLAMNVVGATDYPYAIEEDLSGVWIKGNWAAGDNTIYLEYADGHAPAPGSVFDIYSQFEDMGGLTDLSTGSAYPECVDGELVLHNDGSKRAVVKVNTEIPYDDYIFEVRAKRGENVEIPFDWDGSSQESTYGGTINRAMYYYISWDSSNYRFDLTTTSALASYPMTLDYSYHKYTMVRHGTSVDIYDDGVPTISHSSVADYGNYIALQCREKTGSGAGIGATYDWVRVRKYTATPPTVQAVDMVDYLELHVTCTESLTGHQIFIPSNYLVLNASEDSLHITNVEPGTETTGPSGDGDDGEYVPTLGERYSQYIDTIFPDDVAMEDINAWAMIANVVTVWTTHVGEDIFWLFVLPLPILAYWIKTKSVELPTIVYLVLGGMFYGLAPEVMQTPARIMLMFGIAGMMYHFFKNRG